MKTPDPHDELERLLGRFAPASPGDDLMTRLRSARPVSTPKVARFSVWIPTAAAAAIAMAFLMYRGPTDDDTLGGDRRILSNMIIPLENRQHLMEVADFGIVHDTSERPVRLIRTTWLDEFVYANGPEGKRMTEARVRQEILPVSLEIY